GCGYRQVDKGGSPYMKRNLGDPVEALPAFGAPGSRFIGIAPEAAIIDNFYTGKQRSQGTGGGRLGCPALAADQNPADARIDCVQYERSSHALLSDNSGKWENRWH